MGMKIGMTVPSMIAGLDRATLLEWFRRVDEGPFSTLAIGERIAYDNVEMFTTLGPEPTGGQEDQRSPCFSPVAERQSIFLRRACPPRQLWQRLRRGHDHLPGEECH